MAGPDDAFVGLRLASLILGGRVQSGERFRVGIGSNELIINGKKTLTIVAELRLEPITNWLQLLEIFIFCVGRSATRRLSASLIA